MKVSIAILALTLSIGVTVVSAQNAAPPRVPGIDTLGMDRSVRPQDDFYRFVNGAWDDKMPIPADRSNYGALVEVGERAQEAVRGILEAEAIKPQAPGSIGQKVGGYYKSFNDEATIERLGIQPIAGELAAIGRIESGRDLRRPSFARRSLGFAPRCPSASRKTRSVQTHTPSSSRNRASACPTATTTSVPTSSSLRSAPHTWTTSADS